MDRSGAFLFRVDTQTRRRRQLVEAFCLANAGALPATGLTRAWRSVSAVSAPSSGAGVEIDKLTVISAFLGVAISVTEGLKRVFNLWQNDS